MGASLANFVIDWVGVMVLHLLTGSLLVGVVGARPVSGTANFFMNRCVFWATAFIFSLYWVMPRYFFARNRTG